MRALVTGANGFAGTYLTRLLRENGHDVHEFGGEIRDTQAVIGEFELARPQAVYHLAAQAFVPRAIEAPDETYAINAGGTANVLAAMRVLQATGEPARLLFVSSADVYGAQAEALIEESTPPSPLNPYASSKVAAEALVLAEVRRKGLHAVITRAFNHIGPGQDERFAVPAFATQLAAIAAGGPPVMHVGNLNAKRDFLDVRDVVAAYAQVMESGRPGEIYNVCSAAAVSVREVLGELIRIAHVPVEVREDPARMRPSDIPVLAGSNAKLRELCGWSPRIPLRGSLQDVYAEAQMSCRA